MLGQYRPLDSFLHLLDARAKMVPVLLVLVLAMLTSSIVFYLVTLAFLVGGLLASKVAPAVLLNNFKPILILVLITMIYHVLFAPGESQTLVEVFGLRVTEGAVERAVFFSLRLVLFVAVAFLVTLTSSPSELADAFARLLGPLEKLRVPVYDLALILFLAIRFIPVLYEEFITIRNAQIVRGVRFEGSIYNRIKKSIYIIIPVFVAALQRADDLAMAIQARGYGLSPKRTYFSRHHFGLSEWLFMLGSSALVLATYLLTG